MQLEKKGILREGGVELLGTSSESIERAEDREMCIRDSTTPARAREIGSDYIVVGRPITTAADPVEAYRRCVREFLG